MPTHRTQELGCIKYNMGDTIHGTTEKKTT